MGTHSEALQIWSPDFGPAVNAALTEALTSSLVKSLKCFLFKCDSEKKFKLQVLSK